MEKNKKQRIYYNFNYLEKFCNDNNLILINDYSKLNVKRETFIEIRCRGENCENVCNKKFINLVINKNFGCVDCTPKLKSLKTKNTCIKKYGVNSNLKCNKVMLFVVCNSGERQDSKEIYWKRPTPFLLSSWVPAPLRPLSYSYFSLSKICIACQEIDGSDRWSQLTRR